MHVHDIVGVCDFHTGRKRFDAVVLEALQNCLAPADQHHVQLFFLRRLNCAERDGLGRVVSAHDVHNNPHAVSSFVVFILRRPACR